DLRDLLLGDAVAHQRGLLRLRLHGLVETLLELRDASVLELGHAREVAGTMRRLELEARALQLFLDVRRTLQRGLFRLPDFLEIGVLPLEPGKLLLEVREALARRLVLFLFQRLALD